MAEQNNATWTDEDTYWRTNFKNRPYATAGTQDYDYYRPGYQYGVEAANKYPERSWNDVEPELSKSWNTYAQRGTSTWEQMKAAVRDAWDRVTNNRTVGAR